MRIKVKSRLVVRAKLHRTMRLNMEGLCPAKPIYTIRGKNDCYLISVWDDPGANCWDPPCLDPL